jgi:transcriptional regulator with XRE-family HTH domain
MTTREKETKVAKKAASSRSATQGAKASASARPKESSVEEFDIGAKIKVLRTAKKKTLQEVANETGFSPALISQIENNNVSPPIATLSKVAKVLGVRVGYFFKDDGPEEEYEVIRKGDRPVVTRVISRTGKEHGYTYNALTFKKRDKSMEPFILQVDPEVREDDALYSHEGEEFLLMLEGEAEMILGDERVVLYEGDSIYFQSSVRHRLLSHGGVGATVLAVLYREN